MIGADRLEAIKKKGAKNKQFMHSPDHQLADELAKGFGDMKHFGFYLKLATLHKHDLLRKLAQEVREMKNVKSPARLFVFLVKKAVSSTDHG